VKLLDDIIETIYCNDCVLETLQLIHKCSPILNTGVYSYIELPLGCFANNGLCLHLLKKQIFIVILITPMSDITCEVYLQSICDNSNTIELQFQNTTKENITMSDYAVMPSYKYHYSLMKSPSLKYTYYSLYNELKNLDGKFIYFMVEQNFSRIKLFSIDSKHEYLVYNADKEYMEMHFGQIGAYYKCSLFGATDVRIELYDTDGMRISPAHIIAFTENVLRIKNEKCIHNIIKCQS
jgi:hypothetical protein